MTKVVIIGATGSVGRVARQLFLKKNDALTLFSRRSERLKPIDSTREVAVSGDVMNAGDLDKAISGKQPESGRLVESDLNRLRYQNDLELADRFTVFANNLGVSPATGRTEEKTLGQSIKCRYH